jgi:hypothetical protein
MVAVFLHERGAGRHQPEGAACKNVASRQARRRGWYLGFAAIDRKQSTAPASA